MLAIRQFLECMVGPREPCYVRRRIDVVELRRCVLMRTQDEIALLVGLSWLLAEECIEAWQMQRAANALVEILMTAGDPMRWN